MGSNKFRRGSERIQRRKDAPSYMKQNSSLIERNDSKLAQSNQVLTPIQNIGQTIFSMGANNENVSTKDVESDISVNENILQEESKAVLEKDKANQ